MCPVLNSIWIYFIPNNKKKDTHTKILNTHSTFHYQMHYVNGRFTRISQKQCVRENQERQQQMKWDRNWLRELSVYAMLLCTKKNNTHLHTALIHTPHVYETVLTVLSVYESRQLVRAFSFAYTDSHSTIHLNGMNILNGTTITLTLNMQRWCESDRDG